MSGRDRIRSLGHSVLIEAKVSRSDFLADRRKPFRQTPEYGMGSQRFYICPKGMIKKEELPDGWGLIYVYPDGKAVKQYSPWSGNIAERAEPLPKNILAEHGLMYSALRRLHIRGRIDEIYDPKPDGESE